MSSLQRFAGSTRRKCSTQEVPHGTEGPPQHQAQLHCAGNQRHDRGSTAAPVLKSGADKVQKPRSSYHRDVEEALSSLLWQPYEYQNSDVVSVINVHSNKKVRVLGGWVPLLNMLSIAYTEKKVIQLQWHSIR